MVTIGGTVTSGISASGPATFVGNTVLNNALNVSGPVSLASTLSGATGLSVQGGAIVEGGLYVSGATTFGDANGDAHNITGSLSVYRDDGVILLGVNPSTYTTTVKGLSVSYEDITTTLQTSSQASYIIGINAGDSDTDYCVMSASTAGSGSLLVIKDEVTSRAGTKIYVSASAGDTIDGQAYYIITGSMASINLYSDGVDKWFIF